MAYNVEICQRRFLVPVTEVWYCETRTVVESGDFSLVVEPEDDTTPSLDGSAHIIYGLRGISGFLRIRTLRNGHNPLVDDHNIWPGDGFIDNASLKPNEKLQIIFDKYNLTFKGDKYVEERPRSFVSSLCSRFMTLVGR